MEGSALITGVVIFWRYGFLRESLHLLRGGSSAFSRGENAPYVLGDLISPISYLIYATFFWENRSQLCDFMESGS